MGMIFTSKGIIVKKKFITKEMPPGEFFDKFTILMQKAFHLKDEDFEKRVIDFVAILNKNGLDGKFIRLLCELQMFNVKIWHNESDLRKGGEGEFGMMEVGRRAILIRDFNKERIKRINKINEFFGEKYQDKRIDHCCSD